MLFDDNLGFFGFTIPSNLKLDNNSNIASVKEGFARGNMFNDLYDPYKNYRYERVVANNKQEELLLEIMALSFAINDLNLYLDLHPNDEDVLKKFKELTEKSCSLEMEYVKCYGPLEVIDNESLSKFEWINNPWPWENTGGSKYV